MQHALVHSVHCAHLSGMKSCTCSTGTATPENCRFGGLDSPVSCTALDSSTGGGGGGHRKVSNFNCTFFPIGRLLSNRLAVEGGVTGCGGEGRDIRAMGAQSCVTTVPDRSYVMDRYSALNVCKHNSAFGTLEVDNHTRCVRVNMLNIHG